MHREVPTPRSTLDRCMCGGGGTTCLVPFLQQTPLGEIDPLLQLGRSRFEVRSKLRVLLSHGVNDLVPGEHDPLTRPKPHPRSRGRSPQSARRRPCPSGTRYRIDPWYLHAGSPGRFFPAPARWRQLEPIPQVESHPHQTDPLPTPSISSIELSAERKRLSGIGGYSAEPTRSAPAPAAG